MQQSPSRSFSDLFQQVQLLQQQVAVFQEQLDLLAISLVQYQQIVEASAGNSNNNNNNTNTNTSTTTTNNNNTNANNDNNENEDNHSLLHEASTEKKSSSKVDQETQQNLNARADDEVRQKRLLKFSQRENK
jgi:hypothetical protein